MNQILTTLKVSPVARTFLSMAVAELTMKDFKEIYNKFIDDFAYKVAYNIVKIEKEEEKHV